MKSNNQHLAKYIADFLNEEISRGFTSINPHMVENALNAFQGGACEDSIAIIWSVEDVLRVRPELTRDQALQVLWQAYDEHDANHGICWQTFEDIIVY